MNSGSPSAPASRSTGFSRYWSFISSSSQTTRKPLPSPKTVIMVAPTKNADTNTNKKKVGPKYLRLSTRSISDFYCRQRSRGLSYLQICFAFPARCRWVRVVCRLCGGNHGYPQPHGVQRQQGCHRRTDQKHGAGLCRRQGVGELPMSRFRQLPTAANLPPGRRAKLATLHPLGRIGEAEDITPMAQFLISAQASWITGQSISVDGGFSAGHIQRRRCLGHRNMAIDR